MFFVNNDLSKKNVMFIVFNEYDTNYVETSNVFFDFGHYFLDPYSVGSFSVQDENSPPSREHDNRFVEILYVNMVNDLFELIIRMYSFQYILLFVGK